jgi:glycosyltransferase involved in cell wall biosynthesis
MSHLRPISELVVLQIGSGSWQTEAEIGTGSAILHESMHRHLETAICRSYSFYPAPNGPASKARKRVFTGKAEIEYRGLRYPFPCVYDPLPTSDAIFFKARESEREQCLENIERQFIGLLCWIYADAGRMPDLIYMHHASFNAIAMQRAVESIGASIPTFLHLHGTELKAAREFDEPARLELERLTKKSASLSGYISLNDKNDLLELVPRIDRSRLLHFPPWLNEKFFYPDRRREAGCTEPAVVLIGRLAKWKRIEALLLASKHFIGKTDVRVVIVGDGPYRDQLQEIAVAQGVQSHVKFAGFMPHHKLGYFLRESAAVLINTSACEPFGMTIIEAMACGVPIIATNRGGPVDLVNAETGHLIDDHENIEQYAEQLADSINRALKENWRFHKGPACIAKAKRFSIQGRRREIEGLLRAAIGAKA